jgi:membrane protease YdiL (CAAX protease family)
MNPEITPIQLAAGIISLIIIITGIIADCLIFSASRKRPINWQKNFLHLRTRPWLYYDGIYIMLVLATLFAALMLSTQIMDRCGIVLSQTSERIIILSETLAMHIITLAAIENMRRKHQCTYRDCFSKPGTSLLKSLKQSFIFYVAIMPPVILAAAAAGYILQILNIPLESQKIIEEFTDPNLPFALRSALVLLAVAAAPLMEEILFRGIALPIAIKHTSPVFAVTAVSLIFAMIHFNLQAIAPLFILAIGLSLSYIYTRNIIVPITIHAIFNTVSLILLTPAT